ncbi:non-ribosomal peptide synthetase [Chelativorans sp. AA-79]|uniref:non-ribosomal peptide synthetase n=1 Tax=Chelativorans sp. AA-79 TaxID=3028735 RepID=UPI0023F94D25|nr:non-ribosomal peptide synthetase [Chelativorans sp. AA-79]WEX10488.1 non-ribosomal peptide synthetase [Chelativorans sp. AA-79]
MNEGRADFSGQVGTAAVFPAVGYDRERSVHDQVSEQAAARPNAVAVGFGQERLTYAELDRLSSALASELAAFGVAKGDIVGLFLPRSLKTVVAMLATLKAGAAYAPFDPAYPEELLGYMIGESAPKVMFVDGTSRAKIAALRGTGDGIVDLDAALAGLRGLSRPAPRVSVSGDDAAYVMYTSGSTGRPKGVVIPHRGIARLVRGQNYVELRPEDVVLHTATIAFDAATFEIWSALLNGCRLVGIGDRTLSLQRIADVIDGEGVTVMLLTTGLFHLLVEHRRGGFPSLRHVLFGGEVASAAHARRFLRANPRCALTNAYGPTEVTVMASAYTIPPDFEGHEIPIGRTIAHGRVHILDDDLNEVPAGAEGQLAVSGDGLAIGYLNRPDLTRERFVTVRTAEGDATRCYLTGDLAVVDGDGILHFRGRRDRQIKIDGKRIELDEIEAALRRDARLADAIVTCQEGAAGRRIVAYLKPRLPLATAGEEFANAILSTLRTILPQHMIPSLGIVLEQFPMNQAGKIDRAKLPLPPASEAAPGTADASIAGTEAVVREIWERVLGRTGVGLDQNFFDLGGTSLQLMRVHATIAEAIGREVDVVSVFQHPTIRALAAHLDSGRSGPESGPTARSRADLQRRSLTHFRRRLP